MAHPPIHPTAFAPDLDGEKKKLYELVVRHFLACCSRDAVGAETGTPSAFSLLYLLTHARARAHTQPIHWNGL
jgi:hypothetical protein